MNQRATFGAIPNKVIDNNEQKEIRTEIGAIWQKISKTNNTFMSIQLKLSKTKLQELLNNNQEEVIVNCVAFSNKRKEGNLSRPDYKIYEEIKR